MLAPTDQPNSADPGLGALVMLLRLHGIGADPAQIRHRFAGTAIGVPEMLRCAKDFGLKAKVRSTRFDRLGRTPLPAVAALRDGGFCSRQGCRIKYFKDLCRHRHSIGTLLDFGCPLLKVRRMLAVNPCQRRDGHSEVTRGLPRVDASLHEPSCPRMAQDVRRHVVT